MNHSKLKRPGKQLMMGLKTEGQKTEAQKTEGPKTWTRYSVPFQVDFPTIHFMISNKPIRL